MPINPVKIPQNVYIEDRIVGSVTLRQIIIVCFGGGFSYLLWSLFTVGGTVGIPLTILAWIPCAISVLFAFVRFNDLSLLHICFLLLERFVKPSVRVWSPRRGLIVNIRTFSTAPRLQNETISDRQRTQSVAKFDELSSVLDSRRDTQTQEGAEAPVAVSQAQIAPQSAIMTEEEAASSLPVRPVVRDRVSVNPLSGQSVDGLRPSA